VLAAIVTIASKFVIRLNGKHIQPDKLRNRVDDPADGSSVGLAGSVGPCRAVRISDGLCL